MSNTDIGNHGPTAVSNVPADFGEQRTFVVIHGVGRQHELDTLRTLVEGADRALAVPSKFTLAELDEKRIRSAPLLVEEGGRRFAEVCYSDLIDAHSEYSETDLMRWLRTFESRLYRLHRMHVHDAPPDFTAIKLVVDDILLTTTIAKFVAERLKVKPVLFESSAHAFLEQIQLFLDRPSYRNAILERVEDGLTEIAAQEGASGIVLVTHSLGTVVTFIALLRAQDSGAAWLNQVREFITFGSPLDLFLVLFPEHFPFPSASCVRNIAWTNYTLRNDPIATDLKVTGQWLPSLVPGLFKQDRVEEVELGNGSIATAHTDYWHDVGLLDGIFGRQPVSSSEPGAAASPNQAEPGAALAVRPEHQPLTDVKQRNSISLSGLFNGLTVLACIAVLVSSWIALIWWEENVKLNDAERVALLSRGPFQFLIWAMAAAMVFCHAISWVASFLARLAGFVGTVILACALLALLPPLPLFGEPIGFLGNIILLIVPVTAVVGVALNRRRLSKASVFGFLVLLTIFLSLFVGTRSNPSNVTEEFGTLGLLFCFWILAILLFRIDRVYRDYVRGRKHIDLLYKLWYQGKPPERPRSPRIMSVRYATFMVPRADTDVGDFLRFLRICFGRTYNPAGGLAPP